MSKKTKKSVEAVVRGRVPVVIPAYLAGWMARHSNGAPTEDFRKGFRRGWLDAERQSVDAKMESTGIVGVVQELLNSVAELDTEISTKLANACRAIRDPKTDLDSRQWWLGYSTVMTALQHHLRGHHDELVRKHAGVLKLVDTKHVVTLGTESEKPKKTKKSRK